MAEYVQYVHDNRRPQSIRLRVVCSRLGMCGLA
jgi:hypothetical protein